MDAGLLASVTDPNEAPVQRAADDEGGDAAVQRWIGKVPTSVTPARSTGASATEALQGAASGGGAGGAGGGEDVEKIVDQVITRLRTELSLNRERLGRSLDL
jgi:hypothetical protein